MSIRDLGAPPSLPFRPHWTPEELLALPPDGRRHEVARGELLVPSTPEVGHQRACSPPSTTASSPGSTPRASAGAC